MASTPEQFATMGLDILTEWAQVTERMVTFAAIFEARGGLHQFENAKFVAEGDAELTDEQVAYNARLDELGAAALDIVMHHNELLEWYTPTRRVRVAVRRTDY